VDGKEDNKCQLNHLMEGMQNADDNAACELQNGKQGEAQNLNDANAAAVKQAAAGSS
jgi:hypothetical protein